MRTRRAGTSSGFSLVEVMLALGLLGAVLVAITSLFIVGGRRVREGRERTEALSVATHVMESLDQMSYRGLYTNFSTASDPGAATGPLVIGSGSNTVALSLGWQALIDQKLKNGRAEVRMTRIGGSNFRTATGIRVQTTVYWDDLNRSRNLTIETNRF
jgi:type II secretory pathway pseudopilin PulG